MKLDSTGEEAVYIEWRLQMCMTNARVYSTRVNTTPAAASNASSHRTILRSLFVAPISKTKLALHHEQRNRSHDSKHPPTLAVALTLDIAAQIHTAASTSAINRPTHLNMTTQLAAYSTNQAPTSAFAIQSSPFYGILVTEKSLLLGKRALALQHHAYRLAHRVVGTRLPQELCDTIAAELHIIYVEAAGQVWRKMKEDPQARMDKFRFNGSATPTKSELAGMAMYLKMCQCGVAGGVAEVRTTPVSVDVLGATEGEEQRYVHVSAAVVRPGVAMMVPGVTECSGGSSLSFADGRVSVDNEPDCAAHSSWEDVRVDWTCGEASWTKRLVQFDDVEASIRGWDQQLIESFVQEMELKVIGVRGEKEPGGGMKPQFRMLQTLEWF